MSRSIMQVITGALNAGWAECTEEVSRGGQAEPCGKPATAIAYDASAPTAWPVCSYHDRVGRTVTLSNVLNIIATISGSRCRDERVHADNH